MNKNDRALVAETKALINEVESGDTAHAAWVAIQDRVKRLYEGRTQEEVGGLIDKSLYWVADVLKWKPEDPQGRTPFAGSRAERRPGEQKNIAKKVLADPEQRRRVIADLPPAELEAVREEVAEVAIDRARAAYPPKKPTVRALMGDDPFKPDEFWADSIILRLAKNTRELASVMRRGGGLILGAMEYQEALEYLNDAERLVAEARVAAQERVRDERVEVS